MQEQEIIDRIKEIFPAETKNARKAVAKNVFYDKWRVSFYVLREGITDIFSKMVEVTPDGIVLTEKQ